MKKEIFFEKLDDYVDFLLDQTLIECIGYDHFGEDEISNEVNRGKSVVDVIANQIQPGSNKSTEYIMPTKRAPVAAEI